MDEPTLTFEHQAAWAQWLDSHHASCKGVWLRHARKGSAVQTVSYQEALEVALCFGWIDGVKKSLDADYFVQRWTPRGKRSIWSKVNREKAERYIAEGKMQPAGLAEVERARADGRWDNAYSTGSKAEVPDDLLAAFTRHPGAAEFFATLNSRNRTAVLFRIHHAKKPETRARKIEAYAAMLARHETIYP
ncbi:bacteriocin-protection protein [Massilia arenosa]|uniref:Bacteriocin-protection protein n=1 Tax=Zemynaea arenosa TaxID=2561931 RepID=A0A4Y9SHS4_9BURK|nr:YdeI/OmpD-associated family protein [Massilia arenosa]TFW21266.1 bacteriocin-protection protein [Massilia arenosa]